MVISTHVGDEPFIDAGIELNPRTPHATIIRLKEPDKSKEVSQHVDYSATGKENVIHYKDENGKSTYCVYSKPAWYVEKGENFKIVDLVVTADTEENARQAFKEERERSLELRKIAQRWVETAVVPKLEDIPNIVAVIGRGDMFDPERLPSAGSGVDIMLFVSSDDMPTIKGDLAKAFHDTQGAYFRILPFPITMTSAGGGVEETVVEPKSKGDVPVSFDIIPFDALGKFISKHSSGDLTDIVRPYAAHALLTGTVLVDKTEGALDGVKYVFNTKYERSDI